MVYTIHSDHLILLFQENYTCKKWTSWSLKFWFVLWFGYELRYSFSTFPCLKGMISRVVLLGSLLEMWLGGAGLFRSLVSGKVFFTRGYSKTLSLFCLQCPWWLTLILLHIHCTIRSGDLAKACFMLLEFSVPSTEPNGLLLSWGASLSFVAVMKSWRMKYIFRHNGLGLREKACSIQKYPKYQCLVISGKPGGEGGGICDHI